MHHCCDVPQDCVKCDLKGKLQQVSFAGTEVEPALIYRSLMLRFPLVKVCLGTALGGRLGC